MPLRAPLVALALLPLILPSALPAAEIKPKTPDSAFAGKLRPDILGISADSTADSARSAFETALKGRADGKSEIGQAKFGAAATGYVATLNFSVPLNAKQSGEALVASFSSPASENRVYFVSRTLNFAEAEQPTRTDMVKQVMDKYGADHVGDALCYRGNSIVSVGGKFNKPALALEAIDKPLDPKMALEAKPTAAVAGGCRRGQARGRGEGEIARRPDRGRKERQLRRGFRRAVHAVDPGRPHQHRAIRPARRQARDQRICD